MKAMSTAPRIPRERGRTQLESPRLIPNLILRRQNQGQAPVNLCIRDRNYPHKQRAQKVRITLEVYQFLT